MLTRHHPFGEAYGERRWDRKKRPLNYCSALEYNPLVPVWLDAGLERCLRVRPEDRYPALSHWLADLRNRRIVRHDTAVTDTLARRPGLTLKLLLVASLIANVALVWLHWP